MFDELTIITDYRITYVQSLTENFYKVQTKIVSYQAEPALDAKVPAGHGLHSDEELVPKLIIKMPSLKYIICDDGNLDAIPDENTILECYIKC